jgi:cell division protein FtsQ
VAIWRQGEDFAVVDSAGERMHSIAPDRTGGLVHVTGRAAGAAASGLVSLLQPWPELRSRVVLAEWRGERRWDLLLVNGTRVALPETDAAAALALLGQMHEGGRVLDSGVRRIDLRDAGAVRILPARVRDGDPT